MSISETSCEGFLMDRRGNWRYISYSLAKSNSLLRPRRHEVWLKLSARVESPGDNPEGNIILNQRARCFFTRRQAQIWMWKMWRQRLLDHIEHAWHHHDRESAAC